MRLTKLKRFIPELFVGLVVAYLLFLIKPAILGQLGGTFKSSSVPSDYVKLEKFLVGQKQFSRTFWVPTTQRFGYYSPTHPEISGEDFFGVASVSGVLDELTNNRLPREQSSLAMTDGGRSSREKMLQEAGVKYVIVPYDSEGEIFLKDRKYDEKLYQQIVASVSAVPWLTRVPGFGKIAVFEVPNPKGHFYIDGCGLRVTGCRVSSIHMINPTKYEVTVNNVQKGDRLVFSEGYDRYWVARPKMQDARSKMQESSLYDGRFNSFVLPQSGSYTLTIYYTPQNYVNIGLWISGITALVLGVSLILHESFS